VPIVLIECLRVEERAPKNPHISGIIDPLVPFVLMMIGIVLSIYFALR
jgi:hypothetical protein